MNVFELVKSIRKCIRVKNENQMPPVPPTTPLPPPPLSPNSSRKG